MYLTSSEQGSMPHIGGFLLPRSRNTVESPLSSVPGDLLLEIASHLESRGDLLHFSLASSRVFLGIAPALYGNVVLEGTTQCNLTLDMLFRRPDIARHVIRLVVRPDKGKRLYTPVEGCHVSATVRKVAVRLDAMSTFIWDGEEMPRHDDMWFALRMFCPQLRYIGTTVGYNMPSPNSHLFDFRNLRGLSMTLKARFYNHHAGLFEEEEEPAARRFWDMLVDRCPDLEELSLEGTSSHPAESVLLLRGRWPRLRKLVLGDIIIDWRESVETVNDQDAKRPIVQFLEAHPTLETLGLSRHNMPAGVLSSMDPDSMRNVTRFNGTLEQLRALPQIHSSLQSLTFRDSMPTRELAPLLVAGVLQGLTSLTQLRISFILHSMYDSGSLLRSLVLSCPRLTHLELTCAHKPSFHLDTFSKTIRSLSRLRSLSLTIVKSPNEESITDGAIRLARTNPRLRSFTLTFLPHSRPSRIGFSIPFLSPYPLVHETGSYTLNCDAHGLPVSLTAHERRTHRWPLGLGNSCSSVRRSLDMRPTGYPCGAKRGLSGLAALVMEKSTAGEELRMLVFCFSLVCLSIWGFAGSGMMKLAIR